MDNTKKALFQALDGTPSHALVVAGLTLMLFAPLIPSFKNAAASSARVRADQAQSLIEMDLSDLRKDQEKARSDESRREREVMQEQRIPISPEDFTRKQQDLQKLQEVHRRNDEARKAALDARNEDLKKRYDPNALRRAVLEAESAAAGMRWHLVVGWLGKLALLVGLLVLTVQSDGLRQKVLLAVLAIVMLATLPGLNLVVGTATGVGDFARDIPTQRR